MIQRSNNEEDSLNIQEVKSFLNLLLFTITDATLFNPYTAVPDTFINLLAQCFRSFATINF